MLTSRPACKNRRVTTRRAFLGQAGVAGLAVAGVGSVGPAQAATAPHTPTRAGLNALAKVLRGPLLRRGSSAYAKARVVFNERWDGVRPSAVAQPLDEKDVRALVRWAHEYDCPLVVRSGGHNYAGYSTGNGVVVCDLTNFAGSHLKSNGLLLVEPATRLFEIYVSLAKRGRMIAAGSCPTVAIGGHVLCGGMGLAGRQFGLAVDNVVQMRVVTATGLVVVASATTNPDLFWALRGGGAGNFGIVTQLTLKTHVVGSGSYFTANWNWDQLPTALHAWSAFAPAAPRALTSIFSINAGSRPSFSAFGQYLGSEAAMLAALAPLRRAGASISTGSGSFLDLQRRWAGCAGLTNTQCHLSSQGGTIGRDWFAAGSDYIGKTASVAMGDAIAGVIEDRGAASGIMLIDSYGGAISAVSPRATAFAHRQVTGAIQYLAYPAGGSASQASAVDFINGARHKLSGYTNGGCYQGYMDPALSHPLQAYYSGNLARLRSVKRAVDADGIFSYPQGISG